MRIGYCCINRTLGCRGNRTFRLGNYSQKRLIETVDGNLACLQQMLEFNAAHGIRFFRITSDLVPFASHPVMDTDWQGQFRDRLKEIGHYILENGMRVNMHPGQYTLINSPSEKVFENSHKELLYHAQVLDLLGLDLTCKIQIHVGGEYGDKDASIGRFAQRFHGLDRVVRRRLVVENDHVNYSIEDCLRVHALCAIPIVYDTLHQEALRGRMDPKKALEMVEPTWKEQDGIPFIDYSQQKLGARTGLHSESIEPDDFRKFLAETRPVDFDVMLEIKDKEISAVKAVDIARTDPRFQHPVEK